MGIDDSQDRFVIHQGTNFATDSTIEIGANMVVVGDAHSLNVAHYAAVLGGVHVGGTSDPGDDNLIVDGTTTLTGNITATGNLTASNNISSSGVIQGGSIRANDLTAGRLTFAGTDGLLVDDADLTFATATLTATNIAAFNLTGKLTAGNGIEIEGNAFDINGGTIDGVSSVSIAEEGIIDARLGDIRTSTAQKLAILQGAASNIDIGTHTLRAATFYSDVATGTAPLTVTSTTAVANLQASTVATIAGLAPNTATTQATQGSITTAANLTTVGALNAGSITSGFTSIDVGAGAITTTGTVSAEHVLSSDDIVAQGEISASGAIIALSASIAGPIRGKSLQLYNANFKGNLGTTEVYIPLAAQPDEQTGGAGVKEHTAIIMPCGGRVKEIILRQHWTSTITTSDDISWKMYTRATGTRMNGSTQVGDTITMVNPTQGEADANNTRTTGELDSTYHFDKYDALAISMQWASTGPTNNADRIYITVVVEHDWETIGY